MRWTPSIVPSADETVYIVEDDFGHLGAAYRETDVERCDLETTIKDLMGGLYNDPIRVVSFNTSERWSQDVSEDIAREIQRRSDLLGQDISSTLDRFIARHVGSTRQLSLRLA